MTHTLDHMGDYPRLAVFVEFVSSEARIACNPITSVNVLKETIAKQQRRMEIRLAYNFRAVQQADSANEFGFGV